MLHVLIIIYETFDDFRYMIFTGLIEPRPYSKKDIVIHLSADLSSSPDVMSSSELINI